VETAHDVLVALTGRYAFGEVAAFVPAVRPLCAFGQGLLDLDAEDFGAGANGAVPADLVRRAVACRMPQEPRERGRGALGSLVPVYRLLLEVIAARWRRREASALVAAVHIASEYLPLLAWEPVLGHAGDPLRLPADVTGPDSAWGDFDNRSCPHNGPERSAAHAAVRVAGTEGASGSGAAPPGLRSAATREGGAYQRREASGRGGTAGPGAAWRGYLDRQHSAVSHALAVCAGECHHPCTVLTRHAPADRAELTRRCRTALAYESSPIVRLRHAAPVGHGFGVPSPAEVTEAWERSRHQLARLEPTVLAEDGYPLPGLPSLFSGVAGRPVTPDTLVADTAAALLRALS
jgi:hypothetical protein